MARNSVPSKLKTEVLFSSGRNLVVLAMLVLFLGIVVVYDVGYKVLYGHDSGEPDRFVETWHFGDDLKIVSKTTWIDYICATFEKL